MTKIDQSILTEYPHPIAKCYERLVGSSESSDRWSATRYLLEATLKYAASLTVSRYLYNEQSDPKIDAALACLNRPSLGQWSNLLLRCAQYNQSLQKSFMHERTFAAVNDPDMCEAHRAMQTFSTGTDPGRAKHLTVTRFFETFVAYRNKSSGHGSPTVEHVEEITPVLEAAAASALRNLSVLKDIKLMFVSEIRLERRSYVHSIISLMGTSPVSLPDYETDADQALIGHDKQLFLSEVGEEEPLITLHPLAIYSQQDVYMLHRSDLKRNVEYICHHTGRFYAADRIFEDFKDTFGEVLGSDVGQSKGFEPEDIYEESVRMSLIDGVLSPSEEQYLLELRDHLELSVERANVIEARIREELTPVVNKPEAAIQKEVQQSRAEPLRSAAKRILFISYASVRTGFWADLVSRLASAAHIKGYVFSIVTPPHSGDYDASHTATLVAEIDRIVEMHQPDVLLLVPFPSESFSSLFRSRFRDIDVPVLTLDTELVDGGPFSDPDYVSPPVIQVDNRRGGELVAEFILSHVEEEVSAPRFLVLPGIDGAAHSEARRDGFIEQVHSASPEASVRVLPEGRFNRVQSRKVFEDFLMDVDLHRYDGIFCCNDEMALGVFAAINVHYGEKPLERPFRIAGFNNTVEFRAARHADHRKLLVGSVDQGLEKYIETVFHSIAEILKGNTVSQRNVIDPTIESYQ